MAVSNPDGNVEIHPGPRGFSVVSVGKTTDGKSARFTTDEPRTLNPIELPVGPQGIKGETGNPGRSAVRVESADNGGTAGYRVFQWDPTLQGETMIHGDTGVRLLADGTTWVRRLGYVVESNTIDATTLPVGFRPVSPEATGALFTTNDPWPDPLPGTEQAPPAPVMGLSGYEADQAGGYPGTAQEWLDSVYRTVLPPGGTTGQVLTRTASGSAFQDAPSYGPDVWVNVTLADWAPKNGGVAQARISAGTVELIGLLEYVGPTKSVGWLSTDMLRIGTLPPAMAPEHGVDVPITTYRSSDNRATMARLVVSPQGVISLAAIGVGEGPAAVGFTAKATVAQVNLTAVSFALRNSGPTA